MTQDLIVIHTHFQVSFQSLIWKTKTQLSTIFLINEFIRTLCYFHLPTSKREIKKTSFMFSNPSILIYHTFY